MSNHLSDDKRQQIIALGRLGWSLRRIEQATGVRRETASAYLKAAGITVRPLGQWGRAAKPAIQVTTDSDSANQVKEALNHPQDSKPAIEVTTDSGLAEQSAAASISHSKARTPSSCEPYRELIEAAPRPRPGANGDSEIPFRRNSPDSTFCIFAHSHTGEIARSFEDCLHDRCGIGTGVGRDVLCDRFKILNRAR